jgi:hypothetical protein
MEYSREYDKEPDGLSVSTKAAIGAIAIVTLLGLRSWAERRHTMDSPDLSPPAMKKSTEAPKSEPSLPLRQ